MNKKTRKKITKSYERSLRSANPGMTEASIQFYVKRYKSAIKGA